MDWNALLGLVGVVTLVASAVYVGRNKGKDEAISALRSAVDGHKERIATLEDRDQDCQKEVARLRGQLETLMTERTDVLAAAISEHVAPKVVQGLAREILDRP